MKQPNDALAAAARSLRIRKGYSQAEIAFQYGIAQPQISRLEASAVGDVRAYFDFLTMLSPSSERHVGSARVRRRTSVMVNTPSYELIEDAKSLRSVRKSLIKVVKDAASERGNLLVGHQGDTFPVDAFYLEAYNMWTAFDSGDNETLWNTYGLGNPFKANGSRDMVCHLTVPSEGINRRTGAAYARDGGGSPLILHRGKIGGGRKGLGKSAFWNRERVDRVTVQDGDRVTEMAVVAHLELRSLLEDIHAFVEEVKRVKDSVTQSG